MAVRPSMFGDGAFDDSDPPGYRGAEVYHDGAGLGKAAGGRELNVRVFVLPPGESLCPYHYEYVEEWLLLLEGQLELRTPAGEELLATGEIACFPSGPDGGHKVTTPAGAERSARFVMLSSAREPAVCVYGDSGKVGIWVPGGADNMLFRRPAEDAGYYDGELGE